MRVSLTGHVCDGEEPEDKTVGVARARAVAQYLMDNGVDAGRIDVSPASETDVFEPSNPLANYRNRRVEVKIK